MGREGLSTSDWQIDLRDALRAGRIEEAQRVAHLALFASRWARICAVAKRRLDHDACFAVAQCALRKLASYAARSIAEDGAPPVVAKPWGLLRRFVWYCVANLPPDDFAPENAEEPSVSADPDLRAALVLCFDQLEPDDRALLAATVEGVSDLDLAMTLRLSQAGVRTRRRRARLVLRACLEKHGIAVEGGTDD